MSDNTEKFILEYSVELKESIRRLEQLNDKLDNVNRKSKTGNKDLKEFGKGAADEIGKLSPELAAATRGALALGSGLAVVAGGLALIAAGVKSIIDTRKEYESVRQLGWQAGMNPLEVEKNQRGLVKGSGGQINAAGARNIINKTQDMAMNAYTNPDYMSKENLILHKLGTNPIAPDKKIKGTGQMLDEMSAKFNSMTLANAKALGALAGFSEDDVKAIRGRNKALGESAKMTKEQEGQYLASVRSMERLRAAQGQVDEGTRRLEQALGGMLMPMFAKVVTWLADAAEETPKYFEEMLMKIRAQFQVSKDMFFDVGADWGKRFDAAVEKNITGQKEQAEKEARNQDKANADARTLQATFTRDINLFSSAVSTFAGVIDERQAWAAWAGEIGRSAGGEAPAVGTTAMSTGATESAIREGVSVSPAHLNSIYAEAEAKYGISADILKKMTKVESNFNPNAVSGAGAKGLMQIMPSNFKSLGVTDPFDPRQNIMAGAQLMQEYMRYTKGDLQKSLTMYHGGYKQEGWGKNTREYAGKVMNAQVAEGNVAESVNLVKANEPITQGIAPTTAPAKAPEAPANALPNYVGTPPITAMPPLGSEQKPITVKPAETINEGMVPVVPNMSRKSGMEDANATRPAGAPPIPVMSGQDWRTYKPKDGGYAPVAGESRQSAQLAMVQTDIAGRLGVPVEQLRLGGVTKGDVHFARGKAESEAIRNLRAAKLQADAPNMRDRERAEAAKNVRALAQQVNALKHFGPSIEQNAQSGGRDITIQEKGIYINIEGATDPKATGLAVKEELMSADLADLVNMNATGFKY